MAYKLGASSPALSSAEQHVCRHSLCSHLQRQTIAPAEQHALVWSTMRDCADSALIGVGGQARVQSPLGTSRIA